MTKPGFPDQVRVDASTSPLFPVGSCVHFERIEPRPRARLVLRKQGHPPQVLFEADLPDEPPLGKDHSVQGKFRVENSKELRLVITVCTGPEPDRIPKYFVGQIVDDSTDSDPGGTGVWVAEEPPATSEE